MNIEIKDRVTLEDNNEYVVASKAFYGNQTYYYLVDINNTGNIKFCYLEDDSFVELDDKDLTTKLLPMFFNAAKDLFSLE